MWTRKKNYRYLLLGESDENDENDAGDESNTDNNDDINNEDQGNQNLVFEQHISSGTLLINRWYNKHESLSCNSILLRGYFTIITSNNLFTVC